jgi:hypothetical protein
MERSFGGGEESRFIGPSTSASPLLSMTQICEVSASSTEAVSWVDWGGMSP